MLTLPSISVSQGNAAIGTANKTTAGQVTTVFDDFNSGARANPAFDVIDVATMQGQAIGKSFTDTPVGAAALVTDAIAGVSPAPDTPQTTTFTVNVSGLPAGVTLSQINIGINLVDPDLNDLEIEVLYAGHECERPWYYPCANQTNPDGTTNGVNGSIGINGANMGIAPNGDALGTFFDPSAARSILTASGRRAPVYRPLCAGDKWAGWINWHAPYDFEWYLDSQVYRQQVRNLCWSAPNIPDPTPGKLVGQYSWRLRDHGEPSRDDAHSARPPLLIR